jgi:ATP phosphoribosyltransferase regulatory subunit
LRELVAAANVPDGRGPVLAPYNPTDPGLKRRIARLRRAGEVVITDLPGHNKSQFELGCVRKLILRGSRWVIVSQ